MSDFGSEMGAKVGGDMRSDEGARGRATGVSWGYARDQTVRRGASFVRIEGVRLERVRMRLGQNDRRLTTADGPQSSLARRARDPPAPRPLRAPTKRA